MIDFSSTLANLLSNTVLALQDVATSAAPAAAPAAATFVEPVVEQREWFLNGLCDCTR
ncbi:MAG: hypothetical protein OSA40_06315 [Phycisphaerales bacterium]|nr:hypothetical protein [Phycisphaerales bacterium]